MTSTKMMDLCNLYRDDCEKQTVLTVCFCVLFTKVIFVERQLFMYATRKQDDVKCSPETEK